MDYDWKYYINDLRAGKSRIIITEADRTGAKNITARIPAEQRNRVTTVVRNMLLNYRGQGKGANALIDDVMRLHTEYCKARAGDEPLKRRHNVFVYRYMIKTALHNKAVAGKLSVSKETILNDLRLGMREMLIILFGVPALPGAKGRDSVKCLLDNWELLQYCQHITQSFQWYEWESERIRCRDITASVLQSVEKALELYEEYCESCITTKETAARSLEIIRALYMDNGSGSIEQVAAGQGVSQETIYSDLKKATDRIYELLRYMAEGKDF